MKKFLTLLVTAILAVTCVFGLTACGDEQQTNEKTLYVYTNAGFAPYEYIDSKTGAVTGVDIEIMKEIGNVLGYKVVVKDIDFGQILVEVGKSEFAVGAAGMTQTAERDEIALPSISYATSIQYVIAKKDALDSKVVDGKVPVSALADLKIGTQEATTGFYLIDEAVHGYDEDGQHVEGELESSDATVREYQNAIVASRDIANGGIDVVVIDKLPAESIAAGNEAFEIYELDAEPESYVLYFNLNATELRDAANNVLKVMIENGVINYFTIKHSGGIV